MKQKTSWSKNRIKKVFDLLNKGYTQSEVAKKYKVSRQRISQITFIFSPDGSKKESYKIPLYLNKNIKKDVSEIKTWTKRKRESLGLPNVDTRHLNGGRDQIRELVRARDRYTCQQCKKVWVERQRRFDVHHIDSEQEGKKARGKGCIAYDKENMDKMITVCHKCHYNLDIVKLKISIGMKAQKSY